jgi:hypothetical protein
MICSVALFVVALATEDVRAVEQGQRCTRCLRRADRAGLPSAAAQE